MVYKLQSKEHGDCRKVSILVYICCTASIADYMSKAGSHTLFQLIQALSQTEKRYIKVFLQKQVLGDRDNYLALFDAINKQEVYDENKLKNFSHLAVMKVRLEEYILCSLQEYHAEKSIRAKLSKEIHSVEILFQKGLFDLALRQIKKSKKTAEHYEEFVALFELLKWEIKIINAQGFVTVTDEELQKLYKEAEHSLAKELNALAYCRFSFTIYLQMRKYGFFRDKEELKKFGQIMEDPLLKSEDKALSVEAKYYYYSSHIGFANLEGDYRKGEINTLKILKVLEGYPQLVEKEPRHWISMQQNACVWQFYFKEYGETRHLLEKLKQFLIEHRTSLSKSLFSRTFYYINTSLLCVYIRTGEYEKGLSEVAKFEKEFIEFKLTPLSVEEKWKFYEATATVYFGAQKYSEAVKYLNKIINDKDTDVRRDMQATARIFSLIAHYELGNQELLRYMVKWTYHFLSKRQIVFKFESIILDFIGKKSRQMDTRKKTIEAFKELKEELVKLLPDPYERRPLDEFEFIEWLESKIENKPFAEIIKKKNNK